MIAIIYLLEAGLFCAALGAYKSAALPPQWNSVAGATMLVGIGVASAAILVLIVLFMRGRPGSARAMVVAIGANLITVSISFVVAEGLLHMIATPGVTGVKIGAVDLPSTWDHIRRENLLLMRSATPTGTWVEPYIVSDPELGWTNGPNRTSADGLYASSVEGIRTAVAGVTLAERTPSYRVAIVGDSYTFSLEVPFVDSWGYHLEELLGKDTQVLNFGVDGYGVDQSFLRYQRDVVAWQPDVVLLGFIQDDFWRSTFVYPLVDRGWMIPFSKPRFVVNEQDDLSVINIPLLAPAQILSTLNVLDLPFVDFAVGYEPLQWYLRRDGVPLLLRYLHALFPRWPTAGEHNSLEAIVELNVRLLEEFVQLATRNGSIPILVYFPTGSDFESTRRDSLAKRVLERFGQPVIDLTRCLSEVPHESRRVPSGNHYTGLANRRAAECVVDELRGPHSQFP
jgi:hypothetical protein